MTFSLSQLVGYLDEIGLLAPGFSCPVSFDLHGVSSLANPRDGTLSWARAGNLPTLPDRLVLICDHSQGRMACGGAVLVPTLNPRLAFIKAMTRFIPMPRPHGVAAGAVVHASARLGRDVYVGPFAVIGEGVSIGDRTVIHGHVYICCPARIGRDCTIHGGVVIGADGFGYERDETGELIKFPHIGGVVIEDDVEIGANTCIDRGTLDDTVIRRGAKIDDLCYVAHNSEVGEDAILAGGSAVSGGTVIGRAAWLSPGSVIKQSVRVGEGAVVGLGTVVLRDVEERRTVVGVPARSLKP